MSDFSVKFIGGEYALPSELKEYLKICDKFSQISQFLSNALLETMQNIFYYRWEALSGWCD